MAFDINLNLTMDVFRFGFYPPAAPVYTGIPCQLYVYSRSTEAFAGTNDYTLRFLPDPTKSFQNKDLLRIVSLGVTSYYQAYACHWVHRDFSNEYWQYKVISSDAAGSVYNQLP